MHLVSLPSHSSNEDGEEDEDYQSVLEYTVTKVGENKDLDKAYSLSEPNGEIHICR